MGNIIRNNQREKSRMEQGRTSSHAPAAFSIIRDTGAAIAKQAITKTKPQKAKHCYTSKIGANIVYIIAVLAWCQMCCSLMK